MKGLNLYKIKCKGMMGQESYVVATDPTTAIEKLEVKMHLLPDYKHINVEMESITHISSDSKFRSLLVV